MGIIMNLLTGCGILTREDKKISTVDYNLSYLLYVSTKNNHPELTKEVIEKGVDINLFADGLSDSPDVADFDNLSSPLLVSAICGNEHIDVYPFVDK